MTCSKCGYELNDDMIFCPHCGTEVSIVPEFVPEVEISIEQSIQDISLELNENDEDIDFGVGGETSNMMGETADYLSDTLAYDTVEILGEETLAKSVPARFRFIYMCGLGILLIGLITFLAVMIYRDNSAGYQIKKGDSSFDSGN